MTAERIASVRRWVEAQLPDDHGLAHLADCVTRTSEARGWLTEVRDRFAEGLAWWAVEGSGEPSDVVFEVADSSVPIPTLDRFDLLAATCAFGEDVEGELGMVDASIEDKAAACLYLVASRLGYALLDRVDEKTLYAVAEGHDPDEWASIEGDLDLDIEPECRDPFE